MWMDIMKEFGCSVTSALLSGHSRFQDATALFVRSVRGPEAKIHNEERPADNTGR